MRFRIIQKLREAGAVSRKTAATIEEADLDIQEQRWLEYFAGVFLGKVKKKEDKRYFIQEILDLQIKS